MQKITQITSRYAKKQGTKNAWTLIESETKEVTEEMHRNATGNDTVKWFRRLGGSEYREFQYTDCGYKCTKSISQSPDRQQKTIREYKFQWINQDSSLKNKGTQKSPFGIGS